MQATVIDVLKDEEWDKHFTVLGLCFECYVRNVGSSMLFGIVVRDCSEDTAYEFQTLSIYRKKVSWKLCAQDQYLMEEEMIARVEDALRVLSELAFGDSFLRGWLGILLHRTWYVYLEELLSLSIET